MRIGFVAPFVTAIREPHVGGSQALLADIASGLAGRGHDVSVFAASGSEIDGVDVVDTGIDPSLLAATFFRASEADATTFDITRDVFTHVYGLVRSRSFDVVHNHAFDAPAIELADAAAPVVHTLHLPPTPAIAAALERAPGPRTVACVSESSARGWRELTTVDVVLRNGVPIDRIAWTARAGNGALFAGRFSPEKGAAEAIEIAGAAGIALELVGDAYDPVYAREYIEPYRDRVTIHSSIPRAELWQRMAASSVVLCPVSWDEPFGLVAAEAQAAGTPVVAFSRGALAEVVIDGVTGRLVGSVTEAVEAVKTIASIDRAACRAHAESDLSLLSTLDAHEALYGSVARCAA